MAAYRSTFLQTVTDRGFIHQGTDLAGLDALMAEGPVTAYIGFDATASSLHAGSLTQIMLLYWLQQTGHRPIVLMGGGTTRVGDPSGKEESRQLLDDATIAANLTGIKAVFDKFLAFGDGPTEAVMVNNADWLDGLQYIPFLRDYGQHFTINRMLNFESVRLRLDRETPLTFLEFNYMILQAYDFLELYRRQGCRLQLGGSDQWGNIVNGIELTRRVDGAELYGLTSPLLTTSSGAKMGKTADGAVWLNAEHTSPYAYWQYWRNTEDADVGRFLRLFTDLPLDEIARLEQLEGADVNEAKKALANAATRLCHGTDAAAHAEETARRTSEQGSIGDDLPTLHLETATLAEGVPAFELFRRAGLAGSNGEARRLIRGKGARVNGETVEDENQAITDAALDQGVIKLSAGKKRHALVRPVTA